MTQDKFKVDAITELLARMWIECDPNRGGPGVEPDDLSPLHVDGKERMVSRWKWFIPRAEATKTFLAAHGLELIQRGEPPPAL